MDKKRSVLLVEDNPDTVEFLSRRLVDEGYDVMIARNGRDALRIATAELPSAVVLDINLPLLNGDEVCRELRKHDATSRMPIVFVTAETETRVKDLLVPGLTICLEKAIKSKTLLDALRELVPS
ncbi:MAG: diguanylate cyclase protein [Cyanobacteria bacterium RYN_339]|nr:diguanylate cyclase protein [Cyanobacteria bacterium RYN_339]